MVALKTLYETHKQIKANEIFIHHTEVSLFPKHSYDKNSELTYDELINKEYEIFGLPLVMMISGICELFTQIYLLKS